MSLHTAVKNNNINMVKLLLNVLEYKLLINNYDEKYQTPLIIAVKNDSIEMVKLLLKHGADINQHYDSTTLLEHAIYKNSTKMVEFLLKYKTDPENEIVEIPRIPVQKELPEHGNQM